VLDRGLVSLLDGAEAGGDAGFAVGDGLAVAAAVGAFGQFLGVELDFAEVCFAFLGVGGDRVHGDVRGGGVQHEGDGLAFRVMAGQGGDPRSADLLLELLGTAAGTVPGPVAGVGEHEVGAVHLVAGGAEAGPDRAGIRSGGAVAQETGSLSVICVAGGAGVEAELVPQVALDGASGDEAGQALGEGRLLRAGGQPDSQPTGGDVVDGAVLGIGNSGALVDELLVLGQVREKLVGRDAPVVGRPGAGAVVGGPFG